MSAVAWTPALQAEIEQWLYHEAELLDDGRFDDWLALLDEDVDYRAPVRVTRERGNLPDASDAVDYYGGDHHTLSLRVQRLKTEFAWAEDPPSRTRRFVSNVRIRPADGDALEVRSNLLIYRNRGDDAGVELISAQRTDLLRRRGEGWRLARRRILLDQVSLGTRNLAIFL